MPGAQCTRSLMRTKVVRLVSARVFTARCTENSRHSRTRWCYGLCRALLGEVLCCPRHPADEGFVRPGWADEPPRDLQPASGAGPHDLTVRRARRSSCATFRSSQARRDASCPANDRPRATRAASTASHPASVTIAIRPSVERDGARCKVFRGKMRTRIFFPMALDRTETPSASSPSRRPSRVGPWGCVRRCGVRDKKYRKQPHAKYQAAPAVPAMPRIQSA
jgi:hypothetical protein